jgi:hypothetical protein
MRNAGFVVPHFGVRDRDRLLLGVDFGGLPTIHTRAAEGMQGSAAAALVETLSRSGC